VPPLKKKARERRKGMAAKPGLGLKIWTALLSVFVAVMLYLNIVGRHGVVKSLLITTLAVGAIWLMYFVIGRVINRAVAKELRRSEFKRSKSKPRDPE
jgi:small-conductance mechanosensitive channel